MKALLAALCLLGAAVAVTVDQNLPAQATSLVQRVTAFSAAPAPSASVAPSPSPSTSAATPAPVMITLGPSPTPAPAATAAPATAWAVDECRWALPAMQRDLDLDNREVIALQNGSDTRFPPSVIPVYQEWSRRWDIVLNQEEGLCSDPMRIPSSTDVTQTLSWFNAAIADHINDAAVHPGWADWDHQWVVAYTRLSVDFRTVLWLQP